MWYEKFKKTGSCLSQKRKRNPAVDRPKVIEEFQERPRQSLRRAANNMGISYSVVRRLVVTEWLHRSIPKPRGLCSASCLCRIDFWKHQKSSEVHRTAHVFRRSYIPSWRWYQLTQFQSLGSIKSILVDWNIIEISEDDSLGCFRSSRDYWFLHFWSKRQCRFLPKK